MSGERVKATWEVGTADWVVFSPDGKTLAVAAGRSARLYDVTAGKERAFFPHPELVMSVAFSPDSQTLASGCADKTVKLWDVGTAKELATLNYGATPLTAAVVHRQKRIIPILVGRGAKTQGTLKRARNGLAGAYEDFFDRQGYQEIVELLETLGVEE
jgi:hypothetical protein